VTPPIPEHRQYQLHRCLQKLGLPATVQVNWGRIDEALTHSSAGGPMPGAESQGTGSNDAPYNYERLELLGDAALRLLATEVLMAQYPAAAVGYLAAVRSRLISDQALSQLAADLGIGAYLVADASLQPGNAGHAARLADVLEALVGALYLESPDLALVRPWLAPRLQHMAQTISADPTLQDYKTALQKLAQARHRCDPVYRTRPCPSDIPGIDQYFSEVCIQDVPWGWGKGTSKKAAEKAAAQVAYQALQQSSSSSPPPL